MHLERVIDKRLRNVREVVRTPVVGIWDDYERTTYNRVSQLVFLNVWDILTIS